MHLAFVDIIFGYNALRPDRDEPLGGTTSAVCFLARELAKSGIACSFFNSVAVPETEAAQPQQIPVFPLAALPLAAAGSTITAFIFCGRWTAGLVRQVRALTRVPLIAWMHESTFHQNLVPPLPEFDAIVYVSDWQKRINEKTAPPSLPQTVIHNAMNPLAARDFEPPASLLAGRAKPPILLYAGSFQRGAFHLPKIIEHLDRSGKDFEVEIYTNSNPSGHEPSDTAYMSWLRGLKHVTHVGMTSQTRLIERMRRASCMLAPNPWPETSCIALIEAMASGLDVISTDRAALPETASGYARLVPIEDKDHPTRFDAPLDPKVFADKVFEALHDAETRTHEMLTRRQAQVKYFREHYQWSQRVAPLVDFIKSLARG